MLTPLIPYTSAVGYQWNPDETQCSLTRKPNVKLTNLIKVSVKRKLQQDVISFQVHSTFAQFVNIGFYLNFTGKRQE